MKRNFSLSNQVNLTTPPALDPTFVPAIKIDELLEEALKQDGDSAECTIAVQGGDTTSHFTTRIASDQSSLSNDSLAYVERLVKFLLWARGGSRVYLAGPRYLGSAIESLYSPGNERSFDSEIMGRVFGEPFQIRTVDVSDLPPKKLHPAKIGGHLNGCRVGFDLGASDYKLAAVKDGEVVFSTEIPWNPKDETDPAVHYRAIKEGIQLAASHLPKLDAIGGSAAGIYVNNKVRIASLFRSVSEDEFAQKVEPMFQDLQGEFGVPLVVINDGDVTALAGSMSLGQKGVLGVAMGSSEAAGFLDQSGCITGWLNELAFAPVDFSASAATDEWSQDLGVGVQYFSQQAVYRLAQKARIAFDVEFDLPTCLKHVQALADRGDEKAIDVFQSIGVYLGYTLPWYRQFYEFEHVLLLGRVTSGSGGEIILKNATNILTQEFPEISETISLCVPDEKSRRVGQAVAAASLPRLE